MKIGHISFVFFIDKKIDLNICKQLDANGGITEIFSYQTIIYCLKMGKRGADVSAKDIMFAQLLSKSQEGRISA